MTEVKFAVFLNKGARRPVAQLSLAEVADALRNGFAGLDFNKPKVQLPVIAFAARFKPDAKSKSESEVEAASGYVAVDCDDLGSARLADEYYRVAAADPHTALAFISPSDKGLKLVARIRCDEDLLQNYKEAWRQLAEHYSVLTGLPALSPKRAEQAGGDKVPHIDQTGDNVNRLAFLCQRDEVFLNPAAVPFEWELPAPAVPNRPLAPVGNSGSRSPAPGVPDRGRALSALARIPAPVDGGECYELLRNVAWGGRDAGLWLSDLEAWAGGYHRAGELPQILADYRPGGIGAGTFYQIAMDGGWKPTKSSNGHLLDATPEPPDDVREWVDGQVVLDFTPARDWDKWFDVGCYLGELQVGLWRYDVDRRDWYRWTGKRWKLMINQERNALPEELQQWIYSLVSDLAVLAMDRCTLMNSHKPTKNVPHPPQKPTLTFSDAGISAAMNRGIKHGIASVLGRNFPDYQEDDAAVQFRQDHLAVDNGVVDVKTGELAAHSHLDDTVAVTKGSYRPDALIDLRRLLRQRFRDNLDDAAFDQFCRMLGLAGTSRAQSYTSLFVFQGEPGSGKSGAAELINAALGKPGVGRSAILDGGSLSRDVSEIDVGRYNIMAHQPLVMLYSELGADSKIILAKLLLITGDGGMPAARLPHQTVSLQDRVPGVVILPLVDPPRLPGGSGLERRIALLPFTGTITAKDSNKHYSQDLLDAVVTVMVDQAVIANREMAAGIYQPPVGRVAAIQEFLDAADPDRAWVDGLDRDECEDATLKALLDRYQTEHGARSEMTVHRLGFVIKKSRYWTTKFGEGTDRKLKVLHWKG